MALIDDINNLPSSLRENTVNHLNHHRTIHAALKDNAPRVTALEAMNGVSPESPVDGQTASLVSQSDTLTREALTELISEFGTQLVAEAGDQLGRIHDYLNDGRVEVKRFVGEFHVSGPIIVPSSVSIDVSAALFRAMPGVGWSASTVPSYSQRGIFELAGVSDVTIKGTLRLDCNAKNLHQGQLCCVGFFMTGSCHRNSVESILILNAGAVDGSRPSSGAFRVTARAEGTSMTIPSVYSGPEFIGSISNNKFGRIEMIWDEEVKNSFGMRLLSDWTEGISWDKTTVQIRDNDFGEIIMRGETGWNGVELAGTGTVFNRFGSIYQTGDTQSVIDYDKGASFNHVGVVTAERSGMPTWLKDNTAVRQSTVKMGGPTSSGTGKTAMVSYGNSVGIVKLIDAYNPEVLSPALPPCAVYFYFCEGAYVGEVFINGFNQAQSGSAIYFDHNATSARVGKLYARGLYNGILANANSNTHNDLSVGRMDIEVEHYGISWAGQQSDWGGSIHVDGGIIKSKSTTDVNIALSGGASNCTLTNLIVSGGSQGVVVGAPESTLTGVSVYNAETFSYRFNSFNPTAAILLGCRSFGPGYGHEVVQNEAIPPVKVGCNF